MDLAAFNRNRWIVLLVPLAILGVLSFVIYNTLAAPTSLTFNATQDTYVRQDRPSAAFASRSDLDVVQTDGTAKVSYLKFTVSGLNNKVVKGAKLHIRTKNAASRLSADVYQTGNISTLANMNWDTKLAPNGVSLGRLGATRTGAWYDIPLTNITWQNGTVTLVLVGASNDDVSFYSSETSSKPALIIDVDDPPPAPTPPPPSGGGTTPPPPSGGGTTTPPPPVSGSQTLVDKTFKCVSRQDNSVVNIRITGTTAPTRYDAVHLNEGCTGTLTVNVVIEKGWDCIKVHQGASNLVVKGSCEIRGRVGDVHQDFIQAMGGNNVTFLGFVTKTAGQDGANGGGGPGSIHSSLFVNWGGGHDWPSGAADIASVPNGVVCDGCNLNGGGQPLRTNIASNSGIRNSTVTIGDGGCILIDPNTRSPINSNNRCISQ